MKPLLVQRIALGSAVAVVALAFLLPWFGVWRLPWPGFVYPVNSLLAFGAYWSDKSRAGHGRTRWSEGGLHLLEALGGFPGAFVAQRVLRHKSRKVPYQLAFWGIVAVHAVAWGVHFFGLPDGGAPAE